MDKVHWRVFSDHVWFCAWGCRHYFCVDHFWCLLLPCNRHTLMVFCWIFPSDTYKYEKLATNVEHIVIMIVSQRWQMIFCMSYQFPLVRSCYWLWIYWFWEVISNNKGIFAFVRFFILKSNIILKKWSNKF